MLVNSVRKMEMYTYFLTVYMTVILILSVVLGHVKQRESTIPSL